MPVFILMRHAKAVRDHEAASDRARGLTARGRREALLAAGAMREQGLVPTVVRASNAVRTVETAVIAGGDIAPDAAPAYDDDLYLADPQTIWAAADHAAPVAAACVLMVGHNPGMHELVATLIERSGDRSALARAFLGDMPTASWAAFEVEGGELESTSSRFIGAWSPPRDA